MYLWSLPQCCSLLFIILHYHIFCSFSEPTCHPDDRSALLQFNPSNSWNKSEDCCTWDGVECDRTTGHVTSLELQGFNYDYDSQISEAGVKSLAQNFPNLKRLELLWINMSSVPLVSLLNLPSSLTHLRLGSCLLNGELPDKFFTSFPKLEYLSLENNSISGQIPKFCSTNSITNVGNLSSSCVVGSPSNLTFIDLSQNSIRGPIPAWIFALPYLEVLSLYDNHLSGEIGNFQTSSLEYLWLDNNQLSGVIPRSIFRQTKLRELYLSSNNLTGIVEWEELSELQELERLYLSFNNLTLLSFNNSVSEAGVKSLAKNFPNLKKLDLSEINMSSVPLVSLLNLSSSLIHLRLRSCLLKGELPDKFFTSFPKLEFLSLYNNSISGQIPQFCSTNSTTNIGDLSSSCVVGSPPNLTWIDLSHNSIRGPIPAWILALPYLEILYLNVNNLSGEIGNFQTSSLEHLWMQDNQLSGVIPRSIFRQTKLKTLILSSNNLTGTLEWEDFSELQELEYLYLNFNNLTLLSFNNSVKFALPRLQQVGLASCHLVEFPPFFRFGFKNGLGYLNLSNNHLKGRVPSWFLAILSSYIGVLLASKNQFSGPIPNSFCNFTSIEVLDLSFNNLTGEIPRCIGNLSESLSALDLRYNKLHGTISATFAEGNNLRSLNLNGNQLEGMIPRSLSNCSRLEVLDLGNNMLNDTFPDWLESLPSLQVLVLRANKFHGSIGNPKSRSPFFNLRIMDLSRNNFTGDLPSNYFKSFKAIQMGAEKVQTQYMGEDYYYYDSITVSMKGNDFPMDKILTIFSAIDFSSNNFTGEIPQILGELVSLKGLNLSHNMLEGTIPSSLGNLKNLEWLDLCSNRLVGEIPTHLADVTTLQILNLSYNRLEGPIPHGTQFQTRSNDSFVGNLDLCGFPLSKLCGEEPEPSPPAPEQDEDGDDSSITNSFNWRIVMMGYASGLVIGISIGYMLLYSNGKLWWVSYRIMDEIEYIRSARRRARRRNVRRTTRRS